MVEDLHPKAPILIPILDILYHPVVQNHIQEVHLCKCNREHLLQDNIQATLRRMEGIHKVIWVTHNREVRHPKDMFHQIILVGLRDTCRYTIGLLKFV